MLQAVKVLLRSEKADLLVSNRLHIVMSVAPVAEGTTFVQVDLAPANVPDFFGLVLPNVFHGLEVRTLV